MKNMEVSNVFDKENNYIINKLKELIQIEEHSLELWKTNLRKTCQEDIVENNNKDDCLDRYSLNSKVNINDMVLYINYHKLKIEELNKILKLYKSSQVGRTDTEVFEIIENMNNK